MTAARTFNRARSDAAPMASDDLLTAPEDRFEDIPGFDHEPRFVEVATDTVEGARMACVEAGPADADPVLMLHGEPTWGFLYREVIGPLVEAGHRIVVPDFLGFGRSDKLPQVEDYTFELFAESLHRFLEALDLTDATLVGQDWGGILGMNAVRELPDRFGRVVAMNTGLPDGTWEMPEIWWRFHDLMAELQDVDVARIVQMGTVRDLPDDVLAAYDAPFPHAAHKAAVRAWPQLVPTDPKMAGAKEMAATQEFLKSWERPFFVLFSDSDPITGPGRDPLRELVPTAKEQPDVHIEDAGHFLQEDAGEAVGRHIKAFLERTAA